MTQPKLTRRQFIIGTAGASILALGGGAVAAMRQPTIEMGEFSAPQANAQGKVLVAYASRYGSTAGVATAIAQTLSQKGIAADAKFVAHVTNLSEYRAVIVGSPVISSVWAQEAINFVQANKSELSQKPVAYFLTCMTLGLTNQPEARQKIASVLEAVEKQIPDVKPLDKGLFAGALDYNKMSLFMQLLYRAFAEDTTSGDFRNWQAIRTWAEMIGPKLVGKS